MKALIISYGFTDLTVVDGGLQSTDSFCFSEHRSDQPIEVQMSDAATSAIKPIPTLVTLTEDDGHTSSRARPPRRGSASTSRTRRTTHCPPTRRSPASPTTTATATPASPTTSPWETASRGSCTSPVREIFAYEVDEQDDGSLTGVDRQLRAADRRRDE